VLDLLDEIEGNFNKGGRVAEEVTKLLGKVRGEGMGEIWSH